MALKERVSEILHKTFERQRRRYHEHNVPKKARRFKNLDGHVGALSKSLLQGIDVIAIITGPHAGQMVRTEKPTLTLDDPRDSKIKLIYRRIYNEHSGMFCFHFSESK